MMLKGKSPVCLHCKGTEFRRGPAGGLSINIECKCGARWNYTSFFSNEAQRMEPINSLASLACSRQAGAK